MFNVPNESGNPHLFVSLLSNCTKNVIRLITKLKKIAEAGSQLPYILEKHKHAKRTRVIFCDLLRFSITHGL